MFYESIKMLNLGGWVGWTLIMCAFGIWSLLYFRYQWVCGRLCYSENQEQVFTIAKLHSKDKAMEFFSTKMALHDKVLRSLVLISPLLGLLGTVTGMIETFASLETMEMFRAGGGIAVGVSQALYTTQLGLIVSVPGLLIQRWINNHQDDLFDRMSEEVKNEI